MISYFRTKSIQGLLFLAFALALFGCAGERPGGEEDIATVEAPLIGSAAAGSVPTGLPSSFMIGLGEGSGDMWMAQSGVPWNLRYTYLTKDWSTNWGYGQRDGNFALYYFYECYDAKTIPAVEYYQIVGEPGGGEKDLLGKLANATTMNSYFTDFKILMDRVKDYGAPVMVLVEADAFGFAERLSNENPNTYAAVAASGLPELAGLPNTIAGWGLAFLKERQQEGATNAILGLHVSAWGTPQDVMGGDGSSISDAVNTGYAFLSSFGINSNVTGSTYDFLVTDPADRDADYYKLVQNSDHWWNVSDSASTDDKSLNRYAEWLHEWNVKSGKRFVLWQIPLGNSNHLDVYNNGQPRQGYKDNRAEYFLGSGLTHPTKFADAGVMALLFGAGAGGMSGYTNDVYTDGQLFVQSRSKQLLTGSGLGLAPGSGWMVSDAGPNPRPEASFEAAPPPKVYDESFNAQYEWETDAQQWVVNNPSIATIAPATDRAYRGAQSLEVQMTGKAGTAKVYVSGPNIPQGMPYVLFHFFLPTGHKVTILNPYVEEGAAQNYKWTSAWVSTTTFESNGWVTVAIEIPDVTYPINAIGVQFTVGTGYTGTMSIDTVGWPDPAAYGTDAAPNDDSGAVGSGGAKGAGSGGAKGSGASGASGPKGSGGGSDSKDSKGCSCRIESSEGSGSGLPGALGALALFGLGFARRRRVHARL